MMTIDLANTTKALLASEVERLRNENIQLAAKPCLVCAVAPDDRGELVLALQHALLLLDGVDKSELQLTPRWSEWISFLQERKELWETYNRLVLGQNGA
jgi:hypothetical protein